MDDEWKIIKHLDFSEVPTHQTYQKNYLLTIVQMAYQMKFNYSTQTNYF